MKYLICRHDDFILTGEVIHSMIFVSPKYFQSHAAKTIKSTVEDDNYYYLHARVILHVGRGWSQDWLVPCDVGAGGAQVVVWLLLVHVALLVVEAKVARVRDRTLLHSVYRSYLRQFDIYNMKF